MADIQLVQGDTRPALEGTLTVTRTGAPINLTTATAVKFQMRMADDRKYTVDAAAAVSNPSLGGVRYEWAVNDLAIPGLYDAQWEITWPDGGKQTTQPPNTILVRRQ